MITEPQRVLDVFRDAAAAIRKDGWRTEAERETDRRFAALDHRRTLVEAVEWVVPWDGQTPNLVTAFLRRRAGVMDLHAWNDAPGRTVADVLAVLDTPDFDANEPVIEAEDAAAEALEAEDRKPSDFHTGPCVCGTCGVEFGIDARLMASVLQDHETSGIHGPLQCSLACGAVVADEYERRAALPRDPLASESVAS